MVEINRFCAECGTQDSALHDNFCQNCYWKFNPLSKPQTKELTFVICNECYSVKLPSGWTIINNINDIPREIAHASMKYLRTDEDSYVDIEDVSQVEWTNPKPEFQIKYEITNNSIKEFDTYIEYHSFDIGIDRGICKVCVGKKSGSSKTVLQLRAKNRHLTENEIKRYSQLGFSTSQDQLSENASAYLSDIIEYHGGLDFYFGSQGIAESFISEIQKIVIGHKEKNFKLVTEDRYGQRVYAITYLYRIPEVRSGDIIPYENELYNVINISGKSVTIRSLVDRSKKSIHDWKPLSRLRILPDEMNKMVLSKDRNLETYLIMDMTSFENEEIPFSRFHKDLEIGAEIVLLRWENKYYLPL